MDEKPLFQGMDELERIYAPEELPPDDPEQARVRADDGPDAANKFLVDEPPDPAPVANIGTAPSAAAAPPNLGHIKQGPGDPGTQAKDPFDTHETPEDI
jgi:hypothetical protein